MPFATIAHSNPRHDQRWYNCAKIRTRVEYPCSQRAFPLGKPLRDSFYRCRKTAGFAQPQTDARHGKLEYRTRAGMGHGCEAPKEHCQRESLARSQFVDQLSKEQQTGRIGELE